MKLTQKFALCAAASLLAVGFGGGAAVAADLDALKADVAKAQAAVTKAENNAAWECEEESAYYDMYKCAEQQDKVKAVKAELAKAQAALKAAEGQPAPAVEPQAPSVPEDTTKKEIKDKDLDTQYYCTETSIYYDHNKCEQAKAELKDAKIKDAELDITWNCTEDTEYYDMQKCAEAKDRLAKLKGEKKGQSAEQGNTPADQDAQPDNNKQSEQQNADQKKQAEQQKKAKAGLPVTGANGTVMLIASLITALAGSGVVAARRFKA